MAYDYGNPYYYGTQQYNSQPRQTVNQNCGGSFFWVNNEQEAQEWSLPPNGAVMLMDRNKKAFYLKACDGFGMVLYFKRYPYYEDKGDTKTDDRQAVQQTTAENNTVEYVSREEYTQELASLRAELESLKNAKRSVTDDE